MYANNIGTQFVQHIYDSYLPIGNLNAGLSVNLVENDNCEHPAITFDPSAGRSGLYILVYGQPGGATKPHGVIYRTKSSISQTWSAPQTISSSSFLSGGWRNEYTNIDYYNGSIYYTYMHRDSTQPYNHTIAVAKGSWYGRGGYNFNITLPISTPSLESHSDIASGLLVHDRRIYANYDVAIQYE
ncbi:MAG: hypothetical protein ACFCU1_07730 [Sumerlaeia bacterium]